VGEMNIEEAIKRIEEILYNCETSKRYIVEDKDREAWEKIKGYIYGREIDIWKEAKFGGLKE